jgi:N-sulfoglucosamine sulfohydrolase
MRLFTSLRPPLAATLLTSLVCSLLPAAAASAADARPNILWISCEDISPHLHCYGHPRAVTPTLDRLAQQGVRYTRAFTTCPVCATNRSSMITGMYPTTIGSQYMRCRIKLPKTVKCFTEYLRQAGYYCANNVKTDYNFAVPKEAWDDCTKRADWRGRKPGQPFFAVRNFTNTHESKNWPRGEAHRNQTKDLTPDQRQDPSKLELPPYYPDTPETRRDWANYFENITQLDYNVAKLLRQLDDDGLTDDTIIFFWSDHGVGLPRAKRWLYDSGTHIPLIVVIPAKFRVGDQGQPGVVSDRLICSFDFGPTALNLAGVEVPQIMQGQPFLGNHLPPARKCVFGVRDRMDERYDMIRTVRGPRYRYIRNYMYWKPYDQYLGYAERNETMKALRQCQAAGTLPAAAKLFMGKRKPIEELYDTETDPYEIHNLAGSDNSEHRVALARLRAVHERWVNETHDLGFVPEAVLIDAEAALGSRVAIFQSDPRSAMASLMRARMSDQKSRRSRSEWESLLRARRHAQRLGLYWNRVATREVQGLTQPEMDAGGRADRCANATRSSNPAVQAWGIAIWADLARRAAETNVSPRDCLDRVAPLLDDDAAVVRVAAADAVSKLGAVEPALPVLIDALQSNNAGIRLQAAIALDELGSQAAPAAAALQTVVDKKDGYPARVAEHALQSLHEE